MGEPEAWDVYVYDAYTYVWVLAFLYKLLIMINANFLEIIEWATENITKIIHRRQTNLFYNAGRSATV